jgi:glyoxylate/hydroxypyruvate reductase
MSILIVSSQRDPKDWVEAIKAENPDLELEIYPEVKDPEKVEFALSWKHPQGIYKQYPNLKVIASIGAGIDHIIKDPEIPENIKITRVVDEQLTKDMSVFVLALVLDHIRNISAHYSSSTWEPASYLRPENTSVGILGMGVLGSAVAEKLHQNGFPVAGWSRTAKNIPGVTGFSGAAQLDEFLNRSQVVVCLLPLTSETENILNKDLFQKLPKGAYLINVARGNHLVEEDLLESIDNGQISGASLDVFRQEPLPAEHPFWKHPQVKITPHIASVTLPKTVAPQILENYNNMKAGEPLINQVDREKEY